MNTISRNSALITSSTGILRKLFHKQAHSISSVDIHEQLTYKYDILNKINNDKQTCSFMLSKMNSCSCDGKWIYLRFGIDNINAISTTTSPSSPAHIYTLTYGTTTNLHNENKLLTSSAYPLTSYIDFSLNAISTARSKDFENEINLLIRNHAHATVNATITIIHSRYYISITNIFDCYKLISIIRSVIHKYSLNLNT